MQPPRPPAQWDDYVERLRVQLPAAPAELLDGYVKWMPWVAIVFGAIGLFWSVVFGLLGVILTPFLALGGASGVSFGLAMFIAIIGLLLGSAAELYGGYLMLGRNLSGWWLLAIGLAFSAVASLFNGALFVVLLNLAFGYVHVLVKPRYS